jgi:hypothetical protein
VIFVPLSGLYLVVLVYKVVRWGLGVESSGFRADLSTTAAVDGYKVVGRNG